MSLHLTEHGAREKRDHLEVTVRRVATWGSYHVERRWPLWAVVKYWEPRS